MRLKILKVGVLAAYMMALAAGLGAALGQVVPEPPVPPNVFAGDVFIGGQPAPDGVEIFARADIYQSNVARPGFAPDERPIVLTEGGKYFNLKVQPPGQAFVGKTITFHATIGFGDVPAQETDVLTRGLRFETDFGLHFPDAPPGSPTPTPKPTPTFTPTPTPTPVLPIPGDPSVPRLSRLALILGGVAVVAGVGLLLIMRRRQAL